MGAKNKKIIVESTQNDSITKQLEIEELLKWTGSKSPIEYSANKPLDEFMRWHNENIVQKTL